MMEKQTAESQGKAKSAPSRRRRLAEIDWVKAGLDALAAGGIEGVRIDRLATELGVTKGSFYWHFKNREEMLDAIAHFWGETEPDSVIGEVASLPGDPRMKLELFGAIYQRENLPQYDRAMRAWALNDPRACEAVKKANARLEELMFGLYQEMGFDPDEAILRVRLQILSGIGMLFGVEYHDWIESNPEDAYRMGKRMLDLLTTLPEGNDAKAEELNQVLTAS